MTRWLTISVALFWTGACQAALNTNFAASYPKYQACSLVMGTAKCYKLYCEPVSIDSGQITAVVDVPDLGPGLSRFSLDENFLFPHSLYSAEIRTTRTVKALGRERFEAVIGFQANVQPPPGPIVLFSIEILDLPTLMDIQLGVADVFAGFQFNSNVPPRFAGDNGDFVTLLLTPPEVPSNTLEMFNETQLQDVVMEFSDFDSDGDSDGADFLTWQRNLGTTGPFATSAVGNANGDNQVDQADLQKWKAEFGTPVQPAQPVPEPGAIVLLAIFGGRLLRMGKGNGGQARRRP